MWYFHFVLCNVVSDGPCVFVEWFEVDIGSYPLLSCGVSLPEWLRWPG